MFYVCAGKKLEDENIEYILGPFLMEPEGRIQTNESGFCRKHFELCTTHRQTGWDLDLSSTPICRNRTLSSKSV